MYYEYYLFSILAVLFCALLGGAANAMIHGAYKKYGEVYTRSRMTGRDTAAKLLRANGITDVTLNRVSGTLSDHYNPKYETVNLSNGVFGGASVAAVAVAAHEIGHVVQKKKGYFFYKVRNVLVPVTNIASRLAIPFVFVGVLLDFFVGYTQNSDVGFYLAMAGVAFYGLATVFTLVTLPVELNASRRASNMLLAEGILDEEELPAAKKVLAAAAFTYVASLLTSLVYFLRFLLWVLMLFGRRRRD